MKYYTAVTTNWHSFQAVRPLKVTFHCRKSPLSQYCSVGSIVCVCMCVCWTRNYNVYGGTWRQRWLQWTGEVEAGGCGAVPVWLTFSCTLRLSITPLLLWLTRWTDSTLWFYGERMRTHCGSFSSHSFSLHSWIWTLILLVAFFFKTLLFGINLGV